MLGTIALVVMLLFSSGCSTPSSRIPEADRQVEQLVQAIERNDTQGARALLLRSESDLWELLPLPDGQREAFVAALRARRDPREAGGAVVFQIPFTLDGRAFVQALVVRFNGGRAEIAF